jgi:hypothetical protein
MSQTARKQNPFLYPAEGREMIVGQLPFVTIQLASVSLPTGNCGRTGVVFGGIAA